MGSPVNKNTAIIDNATKQDRLMTTDEYYNFSKLRGGDIKDGIKTIMKTERIPVVPGRQRGIGLLNQST